MTEFSDALVSSERRGRMTDTQETQLRHIL